METIQKLYKVCEGLNNRFQGNEDPFRILSRLMEECGELADQVHKFEKVGREIKLKQMPSKDNMAKECMDIITAVLHIVMLYKVQTEFNDRVDKHYQQVIDEGLIKVG